MSPCYQKSVARSSGLEVGSARALCEVVFAPELTWSNTGAPAGLTSLGLFRPYRASESPIQFRKLALLFLDYVAEFDERAAASKASPSRGTDASKSVLLHAYRQELRFANVHDVVAVLKWVSPEMLTSPESKC